MRCMRTSVQVCFAWLCFVDTGDQTQQLYHWATSPAPFVFWGSILLSCPDRNWTCDLPDSASHISGITQLQDHTCLSIYFNTPTMIRNLPSHIPNLINLRFTLGIGIFKIFLYEVGFSKCYVLLESQNVILFGNTVFTDGKLRDRCSVLQMIRLYLFMAS